MNRKALELKYVIMIIIALFTLTLILVFVFTTEGGPASIIENLIAFLNRTTEDVIATGNI